MSGLVVNAHGIYDAFVAGQFYSYPQTSWLWFLYRKGTEQTFPFSLSAKDPACFFAMPRGDVLGFEIVNTSATETLTSCVAPVATHNMKVGLPVLTPLSPAAVPEQALSKVLRDNLLHQAAGSSKATHSTETRARLLGPSAHARQTMFWGLPEAPLLVLRRVGEDLPADLTLNGEIAFTQYTRSPQLWYVPLFAIALGLAYFPLVRLMRLMRGSRPTHELVLHEEHRDVSGLNDLVHQCLREIHSGTNPTGFLDRFTGLETRLKKTRLGIQARTECLRSISDFLMTLQQLRNAPKTARLQELVADRELKEVEASLQKLDLELKARLRDARLDDKKVEGLFDLELEVAKVQLLQRIEKIKATHDPKKPKPTDIEQLREAMQEVDTWEEAEIAKGRDHKQTKIIADDCRRHIRVKFRQKET